MKKTDYVLLFILSLFFFGILASLQKVPGYMDAEYYTLQANRFLNQHTLTENFIWNYLNDPQIIPVPGFAFWQPVTSWIAAFGIWLFRNGSYSLQRFPFVLMASIIPLLSAFLANHFLEGKWSGWLAGILAIFSGFYLPYITITDTFAPFMLAGGLFCVLFLVSEKSIVNGHTPYSWLFLMGLLSGVMALTRSEGILWLVAGFLGVVLTLEHKPRQELTLIASLVLGFCLVVIPWYIRNFTLYHSILPVSNRLMPWLTRYSQIFVYPSNQISFQNWLESGVQKILLDRMRALGINLQTLITSGGAIILIPLMTVGMWKKRRENITKISGTMLLLILCVMSFIFPYAGERGGFFHSLSSIQIFLWSLVPVGLHQVISWGIVKRNWKSKRAWWMLGVALILGVGGVSTSQMVQKMNHGMENNLPWNETQNEFMKIEDHIKDQSGIIMVNDPPGYTLATDRISVMIPTNGADAVLSVAKKFHVRFLWVNEERKEITQLIETDETLKEALSPVFLDMDSTCYEFKP